MELRTSTRKRAITLAGYYSFVLIGWNGVLVPALIRSLEHDFHQSDAAFGLFYFVSSLLYASGSMSGGFLTERFGRRVVLTAAASIMGIGLLGEALTPTWVGLLLAALVVNLGAGAIDGGTNGLFLALYQSARGGAMSFLHLFFSIGALIAPFVVGQLVTVGVSWRGIVVIPAAGAAVLAAVLARVSYVPSGRHTSAAPAIDESDSQMERSLVPFAGLALGIGCYVAAEMAVSAWVVKFLVSQPVAVATAVLGIFWGGLSLGRFLSRWIAERFDYTIFTVACVISASGSLVAAVLAPLFPLTALLFGLTGLFQGPVYPMIMALGGNVYPHRLAALSGGLSAAAVAGSLIYPPLIGLMAANLGIGAGLVGAGFLGLPAAGGILLAHWRAGPAERETKAVVAESASS